MSRLLLLMKVPLHSQQKSLFDFQTEHRILQSRTSPSLVGTAYTMGSAGDIAQGSQLYGQENPLAFIQEMTTQFCSTRPHSFSSRTFADRFDVTKMIASSPDLAATKKKTTRMGTAESSTMMKEPVSG